MPKGKGAKGTKLTLKIAKKAIRMTPDGRRRLTLSNMGITIFPKCLLKLTNLDELDLSRNLIQKLPNNIGNFSSLRWLDLHSNKLESVPESIGNLVGLTHLNLSNNRLISAGLPSTLGLLSSLKTLYLGMNQLDTLPPAMMALDSLQELGLFDNLFINPPEFVKVLCNLTKVNMKRNPLSYVQGGGEGRQKEKSEPEENVYLVHESSLCRTCLKRCKEQRTGVPKGGRGGGGDGGGGDAFEEKRIRTYEGLIVPNSVATINQDVWRIRKMEHTNNQTASQK
ncbi:leucine-rich repeat-containing protein 18 [Perca fluviatilis]|uniref:leucine-rich repeat-containing protein 18 n=1 Tax=Perca fluviatilis TaxID=8168 RepID=UPI001963B9A3|nr:leucine-rich repeat-containing protein 18 [Perca fluviatilis]XP_039639391.1 leucine-rich repeat-containing protein 18 [Perca fluviatilis]XP_039639392.1 leucine-rich repeat-containing protein 18 [Perca fluviatilis]XP_039639393.1 leucine-rich repeat-containing protein 18 [Perca fluviatilis]